VCALVGSVPAPVPVPVPGVLAAGHSGCCVTASPYAARYIADQITSQFIAPGKILVSNGTLIPPGSRATSPNAMLGR